MSQLGFQNVASRERASWLTAPLSLPSSYINTWAASPPNFLSLLPPYPLPCRMPGRFSPPFFLPLFFLNSSGPQIGLVCLAEPHLIAFVFSPSLQFINQQHSVSRNWVFRDKAFKFSPWRGCIICENVIIGGKKSCYTNRSFIKTLFPLEKIMLAFAANLENNLNIVTVYIAAGPIHKILHSGRERAGEV